MNLPFPIHVVVSPDSPEFAHLTRSLQLTAVLALDAEWKPRSRSDPDSPSPSPIVTLLQLACQIGAGPTAETLVFLLDLASLPLISLWEPLREVFASPNVLKLGFRFKQDLVYLSHTFSSGGCLLGFDKVEPYMEITNMYHHLQPKHSGRKFPKETKSLAAICKELLGITLSKELQCSDWSRRPLTDEQINYAAMDAHCLLRIFSIFQAKVSHKGEFGNGLELHSTATGLGLKEILELHDVGKLIICNVPEAVNMILATVSAYDSSRTSAIVGLNLGKVCRRTMPMLEPLFKIVRRYGESILLRESDRKPKASKKKGKKKPTLVAAGRQKQCHSENDAADWQGPPQWDLSLGGDGCPKFLCDVMVEGLAKHLRCVGIDAAIPNSKKPEARELIDQVCKEQRVLLTRDAKLLRHQYLANNQIYRVKSLLKNEQLLEVISTFQLKISEDQLMSRCTRCNGRFIQKPLTTEEAVEAAKGFQRIPNCLFDKNLEFWQCMECNQLYWEGTQYHNAVQKFTDVCKLN